MELIFITTMLQGISLLLIIAILFIASQLMRRRHRVSRPVGEGERSSVVEASAVVLSMEETGVFMNRQPLVKMQMQVLPDRGRNFVVEVREVLSATDQASIRSGAKVKVKYHPANPRDAVLLKWK